MNENQALQNLMNAGYWGGTLRFTCCGKTVPWNYPAEGNILQCPECYAKAKHERELLVRFHRATWEHRLICRWFGCPFSP